MTPDLLANHTCRAHLIISGTVQGVGYRYSTLKQATSQQVNGWVQNLEDGQVEAVLEGPEDKVQAVIHWCRRGTLGAVVQDISVEYEVPQGLTGFRIHR